MTSLLARYAGIALLKKLAYQAVRWQIKRSENKIDDALLSIGDKIKDGTLDEKGIEAELETLLAEFHRLQEDK
jgi:hypothetical protein